MRFLRSRIQLSPALAGSGVLLLLVTLSFLPSHLKHFLHTRGPMHAWAHVYLFTALAALFLEKKQNGRTGVVLRLALLGVTIELLQTHLHWNAIELADVASDLAGLGLGVLIACLRSASRSAPTLLEIAEPQALDLLL